MIKERNKLLELEMKNFFIKAVVSRLNCYKITYESNRNGKTEIFLDKYREDDKNMMKTLLENLEVVYITSYPGERIKMEIIIALRPIISVELERDVIFSNLNELFLYHNNVKIVNLVTVNDVINNISLKKNKGFANHTIVKFSQFFPEMSAHLCDFLMGYFEKDKDQLRNETTEFSEIKGNYSVVFDAFSISYLVEIYLKEKKLVIKNTDVYFSESNFFFMSLREMLVIELIPYIQDKFILQTNLIDLSELMARQYDNVIMLLKKKNE